MSALIVVGCGRAPEPATNNASASGGNGASAGANSQGDAQQGSAPLAGPAHARPAGSSSPAMGGGGEPIDTSKYDADIERLQSRVDRKAGGEAERSALAHAYLDRANALTKARQYRAALGDYRRTLKYDPSNDEAKGMAGQIVSILQSMGREVPMEGAEPSPLPYKH